MHPTTITKGMYIWLEMSILGSQDTWYLNLHYDRVMLPPDIGKKNKKKNKKSHRKSPTIPGHQARL